MDDSSQSVTNPVPSTLFIASSMAAGVVLSPVLIPMAGAVAFAYWLGIRRVK
jgi:hypothetical protein